MIFKVNVEPCLYCLKGIDTEFYTLVSAKADKTELSLKFL